jgi:omega-6 fatty acid desaturase (delta-12 desaturase)
MRDAKKLLLATRKYAQEHRGTSWWHLASTLIVLAGLTAFALLDLPWIMRLAASVLAGLVHVRLFVIYHDYQHGAILRGSRLASVAMFAYGFLSLNPPSIWNRSHNHHHRNNAKTFDAAIGSYPVMTTEAYASASTCERFAYAVSRHPLTMALGYFTIFLYAMCLRPFLLDPKRHGDTIFAILLHLGLIFGLTVQGWESPFFAIIAPLLVASALGAYLFYAQHNYPAVKLRERAEWSYSQAALHSSSFIRMSRIMHWFTANIGYHHVHHLNARIPFYRLPEAMAGIEELQSPGVTSLRPGDMIECLRLKLWDAQQDRLVPFPDRRAWWGSRLWRGGSEARSPSPPPIE